ncbi:hypothetical protein P301_B12066 [Saccharomyces cerevisiae P301]|nr:hypothetical protein P301_B12066 [Saccharomyces cerevisiae P301]
MKIFTLYTTIQQLLFDNGGAYSIKNFYSAVPKEKMNIILVSLDCELQKLALKLSKKTSGTHTTH